MDHEKTTGHLNEVEASFGNSELAISENLDTQRTNWTKCISFIGKETITCTELLIPTQTEKIHNI